MFQPYGKLNGPHLWMRHGGGLFWFRLPSSPINLATAYPDPSNRISIISHISEPEHCTDMGVGSLVITKKDQVLPRQAPTHIFFGKCTNVIMIKIIYGLWKVHILVLGVPNNRLTCMQGQKKHFHFLICIYFYLICSTTPKRFAQQFIFPNPSFAWC